MFPYRYIEVERPGFPCVECDVMGEPNSRNRLKQARQKFASDCIISHESELAYKWQELFAELDENPLAELQSTVDQIRRSASVILRDGREMMEKRVGGDPAMRSQILQNRAERAYNATNADNVLLSMLPGIPPALLIDAEYQQLPISYDQCFFRTLFAQLLFEGGLGYLNNPDAK